MTTSEKFRAASAEYLSRLRMENMSEKTLKNYGLVLGMFGAFLAEADQPDEFSAVVAWKKTLFERGLSPSTIKQYLVDLQIFFSAASHRSYPEPMRYGDNPIDKSLLPKVPERPYEIVLKDDRVKMLYRNKAPAHFTNWPRNWAMIMLALNEKIRNAEILDLKLSDIDMIHHVVVVQSGKGRKYREVDMCELTEYALTQYLDSGIRPLDVSDDDYLFGTTAAHEQGNITSRNGEERWHRGSTNWLSNVIERTVFAVTGIHGCRSHDLRHVGSRVCLNAGQSMEELQGQLGHAQISTTQIYTSRMGSRRSRESARAVLAARDAAAEELRNKKTADRNIIPLFA